MFGTVTIKGGEFSNLDLLDGLTNTQCVVLDGTYRMIDISGLHSCAQTLQTLKINANSTLDFDITVLGECRELTTFHVKGSGATVADLQ